MKNKKQIKVGNLVGYTTEYIRDYGVFDSRKLGVVILADVVHTHITGRWWRPGEGSCAPCQVHWFNGVKMWEYVKDLEVLA